MATSGLHATERSQRLPFDYLPAKVHAPAPRPGSISRTALVNRLRAGTSSPLVTLVAPAGYGKTTLLAQWAERDERSFAWISIDERDNDPVRLLRHLGAALHGIEPLAPSVLESLRTPGKSVWTAALPRLTTALASLDHPCVVVLDDASRLRSEASLEVVSVLAQHLPDRSTLALAGREPLKLPISALRARGRLLEIGRDLLALSRREAEGLLLATGLAPGRAPVDALVERTEGWAAGLYLAALALGERASDDEGAVADVAGDDRFLADYFRLEYLDALTPDDLAFLRRTSVLDRMAGPLCDAVLDRDDSALMLESIEKANMFLVPLDRCRVWYRYHRLFQDLLRHELERHEPETVPVLHRRAADWFEAHHEPEAAIAHAAAGGDRERAAGLVASLALPACEAGRLGVVEGWLALFDDDELERYPAVALVGAWVHVLRGRSSEAARFLASAERSSFDGALPGGSFSARPLIALVRAALCQNGVEGMLADAETALVHLPRDGRWRPTALLLKGTAYALLGNHEQADDVLRQAVEEGEAQNATAACVAALSERALLASDLDDADSAEYLSRQAREVGASAAASACASLQLAVSARALLRRGRWDEARLELAEASRIEASPAQTLPWLVVQTRLELVRAHLTLRDGSSASALLARAGDVLKRHPGLGILSDQAALLQHDVDALLGRTRRESGLTDAELRLLPFLATHLSFREIGLRLYVSRNTVKTQAISVYRKLGVSARSDAIDEAERLGLLERATSEQRALAS